MATRAQRENAALRSYYGSLLSNPNVQRGLATIRAAEGTARRANPYSVGFGYSDVTDLSRHPNVSRPFNETTGKKNRTTAAGAYQFLNGTWAAVASKLGLPDFGPLSQDIAALALIDGRNGLKSLVDGDVKGFIEAVGPEWASLPTSPYNQPKKTWADINRMWAASAIPPNVPTPTPRPAPTVFDLAVGQSMPARSALPARAVASLKAAPSGLVTPRTALAPAMARAPMPALGLAGMTRPSFTPASAQRMISPATTAPSQRFATPTGRVGVDPDRTARPAAPSSFPSRPAGPVAPMPGRPTTASFPGRPAGPALAMPARPTQAVRPSGPVGRMPAAPTQAVRPSGPVGGFPAAPTQGVRPSGPVGGFPAAGPSVDRSVTPSNPGQLGGINMSNPIGMGGPGGLYMGMTPTQQAIADQFSAEQGSVAPVSQPKAPPPALVAPPAPVLAPALAPPRVIAPPPAVFTPPAARAAQPSVPTPRAPPMASASDVYAGRANQGLSNAGHTVSRDNLGNTAVTNSFGVTTMSSPDGRHSRIAGPLSGQGIATPSVPSRGLFGNLSAPPGLGQMAKTGVGSVAGSAIGSLAGPIGSLLGGIVGREMSKPGMGAIGGMFSGQKTFDTKFFGNVTTNKAQSGGSFPSAPNRVAGALSGRQSNNSAGGMRGMSPAAARDISRGLGGLY